VDRRLLIRGGEDENGRGGENGKWGFSFAFPAVKRLLAKMSIKMGPLCDLCESSGSPQC
jgi:hypothetical protein